jgi:hypothetical protein
MSTGIGPRWLSTDPFGIRRLPWAGFLIVLVIGRGLTHGGGLGWKMNLGVSVHSTSDGGSSLELHGDGSPGQSLLRRCTRLG